MSLVNATLTNASAVIFTAASASSKLSSALNSIWIKNHDTVARNVTVHACPAGEAVADENMLMEVAIPAEDTLPIGVEKIILANTDTIAAFADVTSVCTVTISYLDI